MATSQVIVQLVHSCGHSVHHFIDEGNQKKRDAMYKVLRGMKCQSCMELEEENG